VLLLDITPFGHILNLFPQLLFQLDGSFVVWSLLCIVASAVDRYESGVSDKVFGGFVSVVFEFLFHGAEVHGLLDDIVVVEDFVFVDGLEERPSVGAVLEGREEVHELRVVGVVAGLTGEGVHVQTPAGFFDGGYCERIDGRESVAFRPFH
jgi:hypothetical protein